MKKITILVVFVLILSLTTTIYAHPSSQSSIITWGEDCHWSIDETLHTNGTSFTYRFTAGTSDTYKAAFRSGASKWSGTVSITETTQPTTMIAETYYNPNTYSIAVFTDFVANSNGHLTSWKIRANTYNMDSYTAALKATTLAHEFGHAIGLNDLYYYGNSIYLMYGYDDGTATSPISSDKNGARVITGAHTTHTFNSYPLPGVTACSNCGGFKK